MAETCRTLALRSIAELRTAALWKAVFAEFLGTMLFLFVGCSVCLDNWQRDKSGREESRVVQIALTFGLGVATVVWCIGHVSGGHINPAITIPMLALRKISFVRALLYLIAQCVGAICGAGLIHALHPAHHLGETLGNTEVQPPLKVYKALLIELIITFILVLTVFACCDKNRTDLNGSSPLTIGLSVTLCHLFAIKYTGSSMNPARTLGPSVLKDRWKDHWIYWVGPIAGGLLAGLLYEFVLAVDATTTKIRQTYGTVAGRESSANEHAAA